jgi:hypothetical protein
METPEMKQDNSAASPPPVPSVALRPASQVMTLARMGSFHQSRLSFMRVFVAPPQSRELAIQTKSLVD